MRLLFAIISMTLLGACFSERTPEPEGVLNTAKKNPNQRVCRLVREPVEVKGVYCVTYKGPEKINDKKG